MPRQEKGGVHRFRTPALTVDGVVLLRRPARYPGGDCSVLLVRRGREPFKEGWALPGGFVQCGESLETAVQREVAEETNLSGLLFRQFRTYGVPGRDPRGHVVSVVYVAEIVGEAPEVLGADDANEAAWLSLEDVPELAFDHSRILRDVLEVFGLK